MTSNETLWNWSAGNQELKESSAARPPLARLGTRQVRAAFVLLAAGAWLMSGCNPAQGRQPKRAADLPPANVSADDLLNAPMLAIAGKLQQPARNVDKWLAAQLSPNTKTDLQQYQPPESLPEPLRTDLSTDLAAIIQGGTNIYDPTRFLGVSLSKQTLRMVHHLPTNPNEIALLNRRLLEDAYRGALSDQALPPLPPDVPPPDSRRPLKWDKGHWWTDDPTNQHAVYITDAETPLIHLRPAAANSNYFRLQSVDLATPTNKPLTLLLHNGETSVHLHVTNDMTIRRRVHVHVREAEMVVEKNLAVGGRLTLDKLSHVAATGDLMVGGLTNGNKGYGRLDLTAGLLTVTNKQHNARLLIGSGVTTNGRTVITNAGIFTLAGGTAMVDSVQVFPGSQFIFKGGTLAVGAGCTKITNGSAFVLGDGVTPATLSLSGGCCDFSGGLIISPNATLTGSGTVCGWVANYGTILTGSSNSHLAFTNDYTPPLHLDSRLTNWGSMYMTNGGKLSFLVQGTVTNDAPTHFSSICTNARSGGYSLQFASIGGLTNILEFKAKLTDPNWIVLGCTQGTGEILTLTDTNPPGRSGYYHIRVIQPWPAYTVQGQ